MDNKEFKIIYCPICKRKVGSHNNMTKTNSIFRFRKCNKRIIYHFDTKETEYKKFPPKNTSSGVSFV